MGFAKWPKKDPDEILDYTFDWSEIIPSDDEIDTVTWTVPLGVTSVLETNTTTAATIWISGGTHGESYSFGCLITTTDGRTFDRTIILPVQTK